MPEESKSFDPAKADGHEEIDLGTATNSTIGRLVEGDARRVD
jgi:hypothetical protein